MSAGSTQDRGTRTANPDGEFVITRVLDAPRELVFRAFTDAERLKQWWGPKGFKMVVSRLDLRPGGSFHFCLLAPDGNEMWAKFVYREIQAPERIIYVLSFSDEAGNPNRHPSAPGWPLEMLNTWTLTERSGRTTLTLRAAPINATEAEVAAFEAGHASMREGFAGTFDQLAEYLASAREPNSTADREIVLTRTLDAPRELVFDAYTDPRHLPYWWGPRGFTISVHEIDVRPGGVWRFMMHGPDGTDYPNRIVYKEIVRPERLAFSHGDDQEGGREFQVTVTFVERDGRTELTQRMVLATVEERDRVIGFGAVELGYQTLDRLAALLESMQREAS